MMELRYRDDKSGLFSDRSIIWRLLMNDTIREAALKKMKDVVIKQVTNILVRLSKRLIFSIFIVNDGIRLMNCPPVPTI